MTAKRIASLLASATEILYGIGLGDNVVAVSHECDFPEPATHKPRVTFTHVAVEASSGEIDEQVRQMAHQQAALYEIDTALLAQLRPDLIVTQAQCDVCAVRYEDVVSATTTHEELAGARIVPLQPARLDDVFADIRRVGKAAGADEAAERYAAALEARVLAVRAKTEGLSERQRPRVACVEWIDPMMIAGNWTPEMICIAGGVAVLAESGSHSQYAPGSSLAEAKPEVIVVTACGFDLARTLEELPLLGQMPGWNELPAVLEGRVFAADGNAYFNRSGPRLVESLELLAHLIHPELFGPPTFPEDQPVWRRV